VTRSGLVEPLSSSDAASCCLPCAFAMPCELLEPSEDSDAGADEKEGYVYAVVNIVVDVFGAVIVKMYAGSLPPLEISFIRFASAALQLDVALLAIAVGYRSPPPQSLKLSLLAPHCLKGE